MRMKERDEEDPKFTKEMFIETINHIKKKAANKYKSITKGGQSLLNALYRLYEVVWNEEVVPETWRETLIIQIDKDVKKDKSDLENKRNIHTKEEWPKFFSHVLMNQIKPKIVKKISPFQIGAIPGHRPQEHLFTLKSMITLVERNDDAIAMKLLDLVKFFDSEHLVDAMNELYKSDVKGKLYRLEYEMNKKTRIRVKTTVGVSESREVKEIIQQGSIDGAIVSSSNLSSGVDDFFKSSEMEINY